ncbi:PRA1 family protein B2 [Platanthera guangdongensis]|uniref:PRA1 family protein B2 n=1 Tax=Platanthera guangdongensis TaxID=2320717 RepID=A0ABR2MVM2_9ASPA
MPSQNELLSWQQSVQKLLHSLIARKSPVRDFSASPNLQELLQSVALRSREEEIRGVSSPAASRARDDITPLPPVSSPATSTARARDFQRVFSGSIQSLQHPEKDPNPSSSPAFQIIFLTSIGSICIFTIMIGTAIIYVHGAFRVPEDIFLVEQVPPGSAFGFLSFLGNASAAAGASCYSSMMLSVDVSDGGLEDLSKVRTNRPYERETRTKCDEWQSLTPGIKWY